MLEVHVSVLPTSRSRNEQMRPAPGVDQDRDWMTVYVGTMGRPVSGGWSREGPDEPASSNPPESLAIGKRCLIGEHSQTALSNGNRHSDGRSQPVAVRMAAPTTSSEGASLVVSAIHTYRTVRPGRSPRPPSWWSA